MQPDFDFQSDVLKASENVPIVVDFWADWCAPCKVLGPVLEKMAEDAQGKWKLVKVNTEQHPELASQYRIQGIPAVKMFSHGEVVAEFVGALPESQIRGWLDEHLPTESKLRLNEAKAALAANDSVKAKALLEAVTGAKERNAEASVLLAKLVLVSDPENAFELAKEIPLEDPFYSDAEKIITLTRLHADIGNLRRQASESGDETAWKHYLGGIDAFHSKDYEKALQEWIEALIINRDIDDGGPRKACVALFDLLGTEHELTEKYHRRFTSALF